MSEDIVVEFAEDARLLETLTLRLEPDTASALRTVACDCELILIASGEGWFESEKIRRQLYQGDRLVVDRGQSYVLRSAEGGSWLAVIYLFDGTKSPVA